MENIFKIKNKHYTFTQLDKMFPKSKKRICIEIPKSEDEYCPVIPDKELDNPSGHVFKVDVVRVLPGKTKILYLTLIK